LKKRGGEIVAISSDPFERLAEGRTTLPDLPVLLASDVQGAAIEKLQLTHQMFGKIGKKIAVPANILLNKDGRVAWVHIANVVMDRPDPAEVLAHVKALN
jgi:peroxiredoxin